MLTISRIGRRSFIEDTECFFSSKTYKISKFTSKIEKKKNLVYTNPDHQILLSNNPHCIKKFINH